MTPAVLAIAVFLAIVVFLAALRNAFKEKFEIKNSDIVLALVPVGLWLFLSGQIREFAFGDFKIVAAIEEASKSPVQAQVSELPVEKVRSESKGGVDQIPDMIRKRSQALSFQLNAGVYYGPAIRQYLAELTRQPFLKYLVINHPDGSFYGMADARQTGGMLDAPGGIPSGALEQWLNAGNQMELRRLPGFISRSDALRKESGKNEALRRMDSLDVQALPVMDAENRLVGMVERSKLTASMLMEISAGIEKGRPGTGRP